MDNFSEVFEKLAEAIKVSANSGSASHAEKTAESLGLIKQPEPEQKLVLSARYEWARTEGNRTIWFQWRYYDQSKPFSIRPDMNVLTVELREGTSVLQRAEARFED